LLIEKTGQEQAGRGQNDTPAEETQAFARIVRLERANPGQRTQQDGDDRRIV